jgi:Mycothiol maleylpyruvate isomerase N-terminal domain
MADLAGGYADARRRLWELLAGMDEAALGAQVPACPAWTVQDLLAHLTGIAADAAGGPTSQMPGGPGTTPG